MSRQIQIRRGTATEHNSFTGAIGEITMDTTNKTLRVHDGATAGGIALAKESDIAGLSNADYVVESQNPTAENNYTWYRKYKSSWVEMGGVNQDTSNAVKTITLPLTMSDTNYTVHIVGHYDDNGTNVMIKTKRTVSMDVLTENSSGVDTGRGFDWSVYGISVA